MAIEVPKILSRFTLSSAKTVRLVIKTSQGGAYDTNVDVSIAAGSYYMAWDAQSDDFLYEFQSKAYTALVASAVSPYSTTSSTGKPHLRIDSSGKVNIEVDGGADIRFDVSEQDTAEVLSILGFDNTADLDIESGASTANYQHPYGWYAPEDGLLEFDLVEDEDQVNAIQNRSISGEVKTRYLSRWKNNEFRLNFVPNVNMHSAGVAYESESTHPYSRNVPLECWWQQASQGIEFRVYRQSTIDTAKAQDKGSQTASTGTTVTDTAKSYGVDPQRFKGGLLYVPLFGASGAIPQRFLVSSHTATVLTAPNSLFNESILDAEDTFFIFDQRYGTYTVDLSAMPVFRPQEFNRGLNRYSLTIPVMKYVS